MPRQNDHSHVTSNYLIIDGIYFYEARTGGYYSGNIKDADGKRHIKRAHIYVWEKYNGKVPKGYHVHHLDGNKANNDISNLALMSAFAHSSHHVLEHSDASRERMQSIVRPLAIQWHKSEAGSEWHKEHYEDSTRAIWSARITKTCEVCGKQFETNHASQNKARFCSNNCKSAFRRMSGVDNETRYCRICGKPFITNKYSRALLCSKECADISQSRLKTGVPRPKRANP